MCFGWVLMVLWVVFIMGIMCGVVNGMYDFFMFFGGFVILLDLFL